MESGDTEREERALDALICSALLGEYEPSAEEVAEFINDDTPLSEEDKVALKRIGEELPDRIGEWKAKEQGAMIVREER